MKALFIVLPIGLIASTALPANAWWGKHGSRAEAFAACREWAAQGGKFTHVQHGGWAGPGGYTGARYRSLETDWWDPELRFSVTVENRNCVLEKETRQFLGFQMGRKDGQSNQYREAKVVKRFRY